jgi:hypothetical protein
MWVIFNEFVDNIKELFLVEIKQSSISSVNKNLNTLKENDIFCN